MRGILTAISAKALDTLGSVAPKNSNARRGLARTTNL
jgi:hypothetical protein